jgi:hypothetical protein
MSDDAYASPFKDVGALTAPDDLARAHDISMRTAVTHGSLSRWLAEELDVARRDEVPPGVRTRLPALSVR